MEIQLVLRGMLLKAANRVLETSINEVMTVFFNTYATTTADRKQALERCKKGIDVSVEAYKDLTEFINKEE